MPSPSRTSPEAQPAPALEPHNWLANYGDQLYNMLSRLRRHDLAEEAVQETLVSAVRGLDDFAGKASEKTWLFAILSRKIVDSIRQRWRCRPPLPLSDEVNPETLLFDGRRRWQHELGPVPCRLETGELWEVVMQCLGKLPSRQADIFVLSVLEERCSEDICKELEISPSNLLGGCTVLAWDWLNAWRKSGQPRGG